MAGGNSDCGVAGVSVYRRGSRWAYAISAGSDVVTGERNRICRGGFATDDQAWRAALTARAGVPGAAGAARTVDQFLSEWLETVERCVKPSVVANYRTNIDAYVRPAFGARRLREVTTPMLNAFYQRLLDSGRVKPDTNAVMYAYWRSHRRQRGGRGPTPAEVAAACGTRACTAGAALRRYRRGRVPCGHADGLSPKSVKNIHRVMHVAFGDAVAWRYLRSNPAEHARVPRVPRVQTTPEPWTAEELGQWLLAARGDRFAGMWVLAATTGMRRSELAAVDRTSLDLQRGIVTIADTCVVVDGHTAVSDGKSASGRRRLALDAFTVTALRDHVAMLDAERAAAGGRTGVVGR